MSVPPGPSPGAPWTAGAQFRPGIIPLRPLLLGDIYGGVAKAIRGNLPATMGLALLVALIALVPTTLLGVWLSGRAGASAIAEPPAEDFPALGGMEMLGVYLPTLGVWVVGLLLVGFMAYVIGQAVLGRKVTAGETWEGARRAVPRIVAATLIVGLAVGLTLVVVAPPILWLVLGSPRGGELAAAVIALILAVLVMVAAAAFLSTRFALVTPPLVLEGAGVFLAIRRSWQLTRRGFWRVLGIRLLTALIVGVVSQVLSFPIGMITLAGMIATGDEAKLLMWQAALTGLTGLLTATATTPFTAGVDALLYVDQRIRQEGLDVRLIGVAQGSAPPPWPSAAR